MTKTVTVPDLSDLTGKELTPEVEAEVKRRLEEAGLTYGGAVEPTAVIRGFDDRATGGETDIGPVTFEHVPTIDEPRDRLRLECLECGADMGEPHATNCSLRPERTSENP
jgi:hypothetical protein